MPPYSETDLSEARRSIESTLAKCRTALLKQKAGTSQHTLLVRRIAAFEIAVALLDERMNGAVKSD